MRATIRRRVAGPARYLAPEIEAAVQVAASGALLDSAEAVSGLG